MFRGIAVKPIESSDRAPTADERRVYLHLEENKHNNLMGSILGTVETHTDHPWRRTGLTYE